MSTLSTSAPSNARQSVLRVSPSSQDTCRTGVHSVGSSASATADRAVAGRSVIRAGSSVSRAK